jgi:hypothetical protein
LIVVLSALLMAIWAVAGTTNLRNLLLAAMFLLTLPQFRRLRTLSDVRFLVLTLALLTVWLTVGAFRSSYAPYAISELVGQWYKALFIGLLGALVGLACNDERHRRSLLMAMVAALASVAILAAPLDWALPILRPLLDFGRWHDEDGSILAFNNKTNISYLINSALALIAAEIVWRTRGKGPYLRVSDRVLYAMIAGLLGSIVYFNAHNSGICLVVTVIIAFAFAWRDRAIGGPRIVRRLARLALIFVVVCAVTAMVLAPRLRTFGETIQVAFDTDAHPAWTVPTYEFPGAHPWPTLADGTAVNQSLYQRAAWFKEAARLALENPLGLGFGRDAFGWALYTQRIMGTAAPSATGVPQGIPINSHSSLLELAIGSGVPGVALIVMVLLQAMRMGNRAFRDGGNPAGLMLVMLVANFSFRMLIDGIFRDHSLQFLMFAIGVFAAFSQNTARAAPAHCVRRSDASAGGAMP